MVKAMNEQAFSKLQLCKPGLLLINAGFVENTASGLRQTEGAPHLCLALAREGLVTANHRSLPVPLPLPGQHIPPLHGGVAVGSEVTPSTFQCLRSRDREHLSESQLYHQGPRDSFSGT